MGSVSAPDCPTEPRLRWIHFLGSKKNRKKMMEKHKKEVSQRIIKERLSGDGMAPLEKLIRMKQTFWCFPGAGGSGSAFHKEKERKNNPEMGGFDSHPSVP